MPTTEKIRIVETVTEEAYRRPCKSAEQMEKVCCKSVGELQCCEIVKDWGGFSQQEILEGLGYQNGVDENGIPVVIEFVSREHKCGEEVTTFSLSGGNCCDEIEEIAIDEENTPDLLPAGERIAVYWTGGEGPYTVKTTNAETFFATGLKLAVVDDHGIDLYASDDFCGATEIVISDACGSASMVIRSDAGSWYQVSVIAGECPLQGTATDYTLTDTSITERVVGVKKIVQDVDGASGLGPYVTPVTVDPEWFDDYCVGRYPSLIDDQACIVDWDVYLALGGNYICSHGDNHYISAYGCEGGRVAYMVCAGFNIKYYEWRC